MSEKVERVKPIILRMEDGTEYTLEFSRETVRFAEGRGFVIDDVAKFPMTKVYEFFWYAFRMHHKAISREKTDKIIDEDWGGIGGIPAGVLERLGQLYAEPFNTLVDADNGEAKNARVTVEL